MSRAQTRARKRRRRMEDDLREIVRPASSAKDELHEQIRHAKNIDDKTVESESESVHPRPGHGTLYRLLRDLDRSDHRLWPLAEAIGCKEEEKAIVAQIVAPHLAGMTPGNVLLRRKLKE